MQSNATTKQGVRKEKWEQQSTLMAVVDRKNKQ